MKISNIELWKSFPVVCSVYLRLLKTDEIVVGVFACDETAKSFKKSKIVGPPFSCGARKRNGFQCFVTTSWGGTPNILQLFQNVINCKQLNFNRRTQKYIQLRTGQTGVWRTGKKKSKYLVTGAIISSNPSYLMTYLNTVIKSHAGTAALILQSIVILLLEKTLKLSIERVSDTVSYEYRRVNSIIYLTINSVPRSNDRRTWYVYRLVKGSYLPVK